MQTCLENIRKIQFNKNCIVLFLFMRLTGCQFRLHMIWNWLYICSEKLRKQRKTNLVSSSILRLKSFLRVFKTMQFHLNMICLGCIIECVLNLFRCFFQSSNKHCVTSAGPQRCLMWDASFTCLNYIRECSPLYFTQILPITAIS